MGEVIKEMEGNVPTSNGTNPCWVHAELVQVLIDASFSLKQRIAPYLDTDQKLMLRQAKSFLVYMIL